MLGTHATQAGSLVAPDRLRFDFNHNAPLTREERERVEDIVNRQILNDIPIHECHMTKEEAHHIGAMMLFGEKYGENVRAIMVSQYDCKQPQAAWSLELCGGTHVEKTGQIGLFKIISQSSVSAGVRRLEAVAGALLFADDSQAGTSTDERRRNAQDDARRFAGAPRENARAGKAAGA